MLLEPLRDLTRLGGTEEHRIAGDEPCAQLGPARTTASAATSDGAMIVNDGLMPGAFGNTLESETLLITQLGVRER